MSYLQDNSAFLGTGERDRKGKSLQEFLDAYDPKKYDCPSQEEMEKLLKCCYYDTKVDF